MKNTPGYVHSIMTTMFTKDGDMVVVINEDKELDTLPQYFMGHKENKTYTGEGGFDILNAKEEYTEAVAYFLSSKSKVSDTGIKNGFLVGNKEKLIDCGELSSRIAPSQIEEMKRMKTPSFIRIKKEICEMMVENKEVLNEMETRYIVLPDFEEKDYQDIKVFAIEELEELQQEGKVRLSSRLLWQMSGEDRRQIKKFSNNLKEIINISSYKRP